MSPPLSGFRILDASTSIAGQYCARLFADMGADVVLVEPLEGSATRQIGPFAAKASPPSHSFLFRHINRGKTSLAADMNSEGDRGLVCQLAEQADVIVLDGARQSDFVSTISLDHAVVCAISDFGEAGPYRDWIGTEIIHQALSGVMDVTGRPDGYPLYGVGNRSAYAAGVSAYITCLAAIQARDSTGSGQRVEVSVAETAASMGQNLVSQYSYSTTYATRQRYPGMLAQLQCRDGWLVLFALRGWRHICETFGIPEAANDPRFSSVSALRRNWSAAIALLAPRAQAASAHELVDQLQAAKISSACALSLPDLLTCEHYRARKFWRQIRSGDGTEFALGPIFRVATEAEIRPAPTIGSAAAMDWPPATARPAAPSPGLKSAAPLSGIRVLDFTLAWAGPMATRSLAFLGADVIKIENALQLDSWRGPASEIADPNVYPDRVGGQKPYDRHSWFNTQNHDKRSISLNLKHPKGQEIARRLAECCDVVVANFSPRTLDRLGLGYGDLSKANPQLVMVEMPAFGNTGPWSSHVGMGKTMEAAAGMASLIGYGDGEPILTGPAYLDPIGGLHGAAAVLTALAQRNRTGKGLYVEVAQVEAAMHWIGEYILQAAADGETFQPSGNSREGVFPHGAFPCAGNDQWIAIAVLSDRQWRSLVDLTRLAALADPAFDTLEGRIAQSSSIAEALSSWTQNFDKHDLAFTLQAAGVPAAPVNSGGDVFRDPALRTSGFIQALRHPDAGVREYPGLPYRLHQTPGRIRRPAPRFAEHTDEVLASLLGLSTTEIDALVALGAAARTPNARPRV